MKGRKLIRGHRKGFKGRRVEYRWHEQGKRNDGPERIKWYRG